MGRKSESGGVRERNGRVQVGFDYAGKRQRLLLAHPWNEKNARQWRKLIVEIKQKIQHGIFEPATYFPDHLANFGVQPSALPGAATFNTMADKWIRTLREPQFQHATQVSYTSALRLYWRPALGELRMADIRYSELTEAIADNAFVGAKTMNNALIPLRAVFAFALADRELAADPSLLIKNSKVQTLPPDPLELDEVDALLAHMATAYDPQVVNYFEVALFTGMRPSEEISLRWTDFAARTGELRVQRARVWGQYKATTKTHVVRDIELNDRALAALLRQKKHTFLKSGAIFENPHNGEPWTDAKLQGRYWNDTLRKLGLRHRESYQTRHTYATIYIMNGANAAYVAKQMGNSPEMVFGVYAKWIKGADKGRERDKVNAALREFGTDLAPKSAKSS